MLTLLSVGFDTDGLLAFKENTLDRGTGENSQVILAALDQVTGHGAQTTVGRVDHHRHADWVTRVVVGVQWEASFLKDIQDIGKIPLPLTGKANMQGTLTAVVSGLGVGILAIDTVGDLAMEGLQSFESALNLGPAEFVIASDASPFLVVVTSSDAVHAEVNSAGPTHAATTAVVDLTVGTVWLWGGLEAPVHRLISKGGPSLTIDAQIAVFFGITGLQEENAGLGG